MKTIHLIQNSPEWHDWRAQVFGASDCAAMLGISPYKSRDALLREKAEGKSAPVNDYMAAIFAAGHQAEASIMPYLERQIGNPVFPCCAVLERNPQIAASLDGLDFAGEIIIEHKLYRDSDASQQRFTMAQDGKLAEHDMAQVQQQLLVSGVGKCLFVVSDGTPDNITIAEVLPDADWFNRIEQGWAQFAADLEAYQSITREDGDWQAAAQDYLALDAQIKALTEQQKAVRLRLEEMADDSGARKITGGGIVVQRITRKGNVDYKKIPELQGVDLEPYRKKGSEYWALNAT